MQLEDYCEHLYDDSTDGYLHIAHLDKNRKVKIYSTDDANVRKIVEEIGQEDVFITPNTTFIPVRRAQNIRQFRALFIDLDIDKLGYQKSETVYMVWELYYQDKLPKPTMVIDSGRGVHLYWRIENAPIQAWSTWQELEDYLYYQLKHLGADKQATDSVRVLRLPSSINSRNGSECKILYIDNETTYSMYDLRQAYLNYKPKTTQIKMLEAYEKPTAKVIPNKFFTSYSLHLARIEDIETLCKLRNYNVKGYRNFILHCYAYWQGVTIRDEETLREEVYALNNAFKEPMKATEVDAILRCIPKAIDKFIAYEQGIRSGECKRVSKGMRDKGGYWYKNETLIERLDITEAEQKHMKTIIGTEEKYSRRRDKDREYQRAKRRNSNGLTKKQQELEDLKYQVLELRKEGLSMQKIADKLNINKTKVVRLCK